MVYKTVIFDMDGTLLNTLDDLADSVNYMLREFDYPLRTVKEVGDFVGNGVERLIRLAVPTGTPDEKIMRCMDVFKTHYAAHMQDKTRPYEGICELLGELKAEGVKTAVLSNKFDTAVKKLAGEYFGDLLQDAVGESDRVRKKPAPDGIFAAMKKLGALPEETVYVGDSEVDVRAAKNAKVACIGVTWGFRDKSVLVAEGADIIVSHPQQIITIVRTGTKE